MLVALAPRHLITLGIYSISGREVTTATVAAFLTILGYSIYDTIIIFDRMRENIPLMRRASIARSRTSRSGRRSGARWRRRSSRCCRSRPVLLRRRDAEGLRVRAARRHRLRRVLDDLHRRAAPRRAEGARAGVPPADADRLRGRAGGAPRGGRGRRGSRARAGVPLLTPERGRCHGGRGGEQARAATPAAPDEAPWPSP